MIFRHARNINQYNAPRRNNMNAQTIISLTAIVLAVVNTPQSATAAEYPTRPIRLIVTNAPGSGVDVLTRLVAVRLAAQLGQQVVVDNRPGAGSALGMELGKRGARRLHAGQCPHRCPRGGTVDTSKTAHRYYQRI
jgi:Tripartite tricarboxylate transporter family receptor